MIVKAKFKGINGSMRYITGRIYRLGLYTTIIYRDGKYLDRIKIYNSKVNQWDKNTVVQYSSLKKFLDNWEVV